MFYTYLYGVVSYSFPKIKIFTLANFFTVYCLPNKSCQPQVGNHFKSPQYPVWVVCSESHYTCLFSRIPGITADDPMDDVFDIYYYDGLAQLEDEIRLTVSELLGEMRQIFSELLGDMRTISYFIVNFLKAGTKSYTNISRFIFF